MNPPSLKDAAAVILLRQNTDPNNPEIFWAKRSQKLVFLGGFYAFPGGKAEPVDANAPIKNCEDEPERTAMISCAARETFEETGVLLAHGAETLTVGQRTSLLDDLESGRMSWPELLRHYGLHLDAKDFTFVGRWVTPPFAPRRFDTWFFLVNCPAKQEPRVTGDAELESGEWISARDGYARWKRNEALVAPPVLHALQSLAEGLNDDLIERFLSVPEAHREPTRQIEFRQNYICFPVRTPTKPPATHTNCYLIYTSSEILVIDPGSPYEDEQQELANCVDELIAAGRTVREMILTHVHPDHVAGVNALNDHLESKHRSRVTVAAHRLTAESLKSQFPVDRFIEDNELLALDGEPSIRLRALYTPGHARGHLCFYDADRGVLISGDNVVGFGSVLIDPADGNMSDYLASLRRMRALSNVTVLLPGHGPAVANPYDKIDEYISHRLERESNILQAVREGASTPIEIVARVYTDVSPKAHAMAERAVLAHLEKLIEDGLVKREPQGFVLEG
jgi:ribonuclease/clavin/mitogillin